MKLTNVRRRSVLAQISVNNKPGQPKMIVDNASQEISGPVFLKGPQGEDICMTVPGEMIVADSGAPNAQNVICVIWEPVTKRWTDSDGTYYVLTVQDYAYSPQKHQAR